MEVSKYENISMYEILPNLKNVAIMRLNVLCPKRIDYIEKACRLHCGIFVLLLRVSVKG